MCLRVQSIISPPRIKTHRFSVEDKEILVIKVEKSGSLCSVGGTAYIRIGTGIRPLSIQEIITLSTELGTVNWDEVPLISIEHINMDHIKWFFKTNGEGERK
jgi:ATP-dependent DNA helicase RecG